MELPGLKPNVQLQLPYAVPKTLNDSQESMELLEFGSRVCYNSFHNMRPPLS